jgi:hypothetical protein
MALFLGEEPQGLESLMLSCKILMIFRLKNNASIVALPAEISRMYEPILLFTFCVNKNLTMELKFNRQKAKLRTALQVLVLIFYIIHTDEQEHLKAPLVIFSNIKMQKRGLGLFLK